MHLVQFPTDCIVNIHVVMEMDAQQTPCRLVIQVPTILCCLWVSWSKYRRDSALSTG